jgi:hypothetical protein
MSITIRYDCIKLNLCGVVAYTNVMLSKNIVKFNVLIGYQYHEWYMVNKKIGNLK